MNQKPVFIFASGQRCGSTFLQRLINSTKDGQMWGEHNGYLNHLLQSFNKLVEHESYSKQERDLFNVKGIDVFTPNLTKEFSVIENSIRNHIYELFSSGGYVWGLKEVHCGADVALFLQYLFPEAKFIHLTRNYINCFLSIKNWEERPGLYWDRGTSCYMLDEWARINFSFNKCVNQFNNCLSIRYEDIFIDKNKFVTTLSNFLEINESAFDLSVFEKKLYHQYQPDLNDHRPKLTVKDLTDSEKKLLSRKHLLMVAKLYNYDITFN